MVQWFRNQGFQISFFLQSFRSNATIVHEKVDFLEMMQ